MRTTREQLKALVKELLLEVLQEGLGASLGQPAHSTVQPVRERRQQFDPRLDTPLAGGRRPTAALRETIRRESAGSSVMAAILSDTAQTTLPTQLSHGDVMGIPAEGGARPISRNSAPVQQEQFHGDPADVFGAAAEQRPDGSSHWADLAFMPSQKKAA